MKKGRQWVRPELVILVRNKPEEAVLSACKAVTGGVDLKPKILHVIRQGIKLVGYTNVNRSGNLRG